MAKIQVLIVIETDDTVDESDFMDDLQGLCQSKSDEHFTAEIKSVEEV